MWLDFSLTVINDGQGVPAWDVINDAQAGKAFLKFKTHPTQNMGRD
jgi:hypothetical protein